MNIADIGKPKVRLTLEIDEATYNLWRKIASGYEELPEDFNPDDHAGGNMDDCFALGEEHGSNWAFSEVMGCVVSVEMPNDV